MGNGGKGGIYAQQPKPYMTHFSSAVPKKTGVVALQQRTACLQ